MCQHDNIIKLIDLSETGEEHHVVMELMQGGDLFDYLSSRDFNIGEQQA